MNRWFGACGFFLSPPVLTIRFRIGSGSNNGLRETAAGLVARLYGSRSKKNRKLMETLQAEADRIGEELKLYDAQSSQD